MYQNVLFPALSRFDPETTHEHVLSVLAMMGKRRAVLSILKPLFSYQDPRLQVEVLGLRFANPLGIAAGFDKNAVAAESLAALGFGHVEVGTVTPEPQLGNPRPRLFRLTEDRALINRMGFNGFGTKAVQTQLGSLSRRDFVLGINVGANKSSVEARTEDDDYSLAFHRLAWYGDYVTINVSSPNTAGLRELQGKAALNHLVMRIVRERDTHLPGKPVLVKIAPDLSRREIYDVLDVVTSQKVDGIIATNTTLERPSSLRSSNRKEGGGLSGVPLAPKSQGVIRYIREIAGGKIPIIGVGGVFDYQDVIDKMMAGASVVQTYTGFIYQGPAMSRNINRGLARFVDQEGIRSIQEIVGTAV